MSTGKNIRGALSYNEQKVRQGSAELILASRFARDISEMGFTEKLLRFEKLNQLNEKTKTNTLHLSLNFSPEDFPPGNLSNEDKLRAIALDYMERIGFGDQPFLVYQHRDTGHPHLHIVTATIRPNGKPIYLHNLAKRKSEPARKAIEIEYNLVIAEGRKETLGASAKMSNTVSMVVAQYKFSSLEELNAILRQFNIMADRGDPNSFMFKKNGLVFCQIDKDGYKTGKAIKASSIYKSPTLSVLEKTFVQNTTKKPFYLKKVQVKVLSALTKSASTFDFLENLKSQDIGASIQYGAGQLITQVSFVDHTTRTVFNCNDLGITIDDLLGKLNYQKSAVPGFSNSADQNGVKDNHRDPSASYPLSIIKTLFSSDHFQPEVSPEFLKKKRKRKKR